MVEERVREQGIAYICVGSNVKKNIPRSHYEVRIGTAVLVYIDLPGAGAGSVLCLIA